MSYCNQNFVTQISTLTPDWKNLKRVLESEMTGVWSLLQLVVRIFYNLKIPELRDSYLIELMCDFGLAF